MINSIVDQFEEVFTLCSDKAAREAFINNLIVLTQKRGPRHSAILTMRSDYASYVARIPYLQKLFEPAQVIVTALSRPELQEAIEKPAELIGLKFEEGVVEQLIDDVVGEPAGLPLLQFTLFSLWQHRERNRVTMNSYHRIGGGRLALASSADALYDNLLREDQPTARRMLLRMVRLSERLEPTSNRIRRSALYTTGEDPGRIDRVLNRFIGAGLIRLTETDTPEDTQIEVAHEALIRNWPKLLEWLQADWEMLRQRQNVTVAAERWNAIGKDPSALIGKGKLLDEAMRWRPDLDQIEREFVRASYLAVANADFEQEEARIAIDQAQKRELEQARRAEAEQSLRAKAERARAEEQERRADAERERAETQISTSARLRLLSFALLIVMTLAIAAAVWALFTQQRVVNALQSAEASQTTAVAAVATSSAALKIGLEARTQAAQVTATSAAVQATTNALAIRNSTAQAQATLVQNQIGSMQLTSTAVTSYNLTLNVANADVQEQVNFAQATGTAVQSSTMAFVATQQMAQTEALAAESTRAAAHDDATQLQGTIVVSAGTAAALDSTVSAFKLALIDTQATATDIAIQLSETAMSLQATVAASQPTSTPTPTSTSTPTPTPISTPLLSPPLR